MLSGIDLIIAGTNLGLCLFGFDWPENLMGVMESNIGTRMVRVLNNVPCVIHPRSGKIGLIDMASTEFDRNAWS